MTHYDAVEAGQICFLWCLRNLGLSEVKSFSVGHTARQGWYPLSSSNGHSSCYSGKFLHTGWQCCCLKSSSPPKNLHHPSCPVFSPASPPKLPTVWQLQGSRLQWWFLPGSGRLPLGAGVRKIGGGLKVGERLEGGSPSRGLWVASVYLLD